METREYYEKHKNEIFKKYSNEELIKDIDNFKNGKGKLYKVLNHFFEENIYKYLKVGGYAMINIKNMTSGKKLPLFDDWFKIFKDIDGFEFVEVFEINHQSKRNVTMNTTYTEEQYKGFKEPVMVFRKVG